MFSSAIFVDTYSRQIEVSVVSVTEVPERGLVFRFGAKVGNLWQLMQKRGEFSFGGMPVIISNGGYSAMSSAGFVDVLAAETGEGSRVRSLLVGVQGFPWQKEHKGLTILTNQQPVILLRPGTKVSRVETHANRKAGAGWHSNRAAAEAAKKALEFRAQIQPESVFILEGQSDYTQAWQFFAEHEVYKETFEAEFPTEHRAERFTDEAFVSAALRGHARRKSESVEETQGTLFVYLNLLLADGNYWTNGSWKTQFLSLFVQRLAGDKLEAIIKTMADSMRADGWRLDIDTSEANHFLQAINPEGKKVVEGWGAVHGPKEYEEKLIHLADGLTEETRNELLGKLESQDPESRGWIGAIGA